MEWEKKTGEFKKCPPAPSPKIRVKVELLTEVHKQFGVNCNGSFTAQSIDAIADTGCQTTTSGIGLLDRLGMSEHMLVPTKHRIVGITDTRLEIIGSVFVRIQFNGAEARQMIHVSRNSCGLYLSESACKQLGIVHRSFPHCSTEAVYTAGGAVEEISKDECKCIPRTDAPERPEKIPFPPTPENRDKLKDWLVTAFESSAFNTCTHQPLKCMTGEPMQVNFKEGAEPFRVHTPIPVAHHWSKAVKRDLERDVRLGIIERVPQGTPTDYCSRMVVAAKKDGEPRRTVDFQQLNKSTLRETHHTPTPFSVVSTTPTNTYKTVLDAWNGYHALPIAEDAKKAFTFITELGRFRYCRAPQGFHGSGDAYTRRFDDITAQVERVARIIDDSLLWDSEIETSFWHTFDYLKHCADNGIIFNVKKFVFAQRTCEFAGFEITPDGFRPPKRILDAIMTFPTPKSTTDMRSWFGLVNQVAYAFSQSSTMAPFRELLKKETKFYWDSELEKLFNESKEKIVTLIKDGVCAFEKNRVTCLSTDWSKVGIGFTLSQKHCKCKPDDSTKTYSPNCGEGHWRLILAGSRFTKPAESRYAPIEGEALAVAYGLQQCRVFVLGSPNLIVAVDHKPLTKILNDRSLESIDNPRLLRIKEKTLPYSFEIIHVPGNSNMAPDATSRYPTRSLYHKLSDQEEKKLPVTKTETTMPDISPKTSADVAKGEGVAVDDGDSDDEEIEQLVRSSAVHHGRGLPGSISWKDVDHESNLDDEVAELKNVMEQGFPATRNELPERLRVYHQMKEDLYLVENVIFRGKKMLIPKKLRERVLDGLHAAHQGVSGMKASARERLFWPGLDADIRQRRAQCVTCNENAPSQRDEPIILTPPPEMPFQQVASDWMELGNHNYIIYADRYSGWTEVSDVPNKTASTLKKNMLGWFRTYGAPEEISSDGGPPYNSVDYDDFLREWGVKKRLSSAYYPQSNGRAEVAVKTMKRALRGSVNPRTGSLDTDAAARAIMTHRNTPNQDTGISPAEMLFGCKLRDHLPNQFRSVRKEWKDVQRAKEDAHAIRSAKLSTNAKELAPLKKGDTVAVQNQTGNKPGKWSNTGEIMEVRPNRQYQVKMDGSRRVTLRNRKFLRRVPERPRRAQLGYGDIRSVTPAPQSVPPSTRAPAYTPLEVCGTPTRQDKPPEAVGQLLSPGPSASSLPDADTTSPAPSPAVSPMTPPAPNLLPAPPPTSVPRTPATPVPAVRGRRALENLRDYNSRGLTETVPQTMRTARLRKKPDRY